MLTIRDKHDLRNSYDTLDLYYKVLNEVKEKMPDRDVSPILDGIKEAKQAIRRYFKTQDETRHIIKDYGIDGYIELVEFPKHVSSREDAEDYFNEMELIVYRPSAYDCTGQLFTGWHRLFERRDSWWCYHRVCCDV